MLLDPEFSIQKKKSEIEKTEVRIRYNEMDESIDIGTIDCFYTIQVKLPAGAVGRVRDIEKRANEIGVFVKKYFSEHPEELHKLGYPLSVAMVNSTGTATAFNIVYVAKGNGIIRNPVANK